MVRKTRSFDVTEKRDRIFALVGLSSDAGEDFIDYSKYLRDLFVDIARNALVKQGSAEADGLGFLSKVSAPDPSNA